MKGRRFLIALIAVLMAMGMIAGTTFTASAANWYERFGDAMKQAQANAPTVTVNDWNGMQKAINDAKIVSTIRLGKDITCPDAGEPIRVDGKTITIDLNGHELRRRVSRVDKKGNVLESSYTSDGHVIELVGSAYVTVTDSSSGGAIYVNDSTLKLYCGTFTGNTAQLQGGGVLVGIKGTFKVHGAPVVRDNTAQGGGGSNIYLRGRQKGRTGRGADQRRAAWRGCSGIRI